MERKTPVWYSIIKYSPDELKGEIINVGLVLHSIGDEKKTKYFILEENSSKIKSIASSKSEFNTYKSYKDVLEYYLSQSKENLVGQVGGISIASYYDDNYLKYLCEYNKDKKMKLSEPIFALTKDVDMLFNSIFKRYIGEKYISSNISTMTAKTYIKNIFKEKELLGTKVQSDITIYPVAKLKNVKFNVDFSFKNGVYNYIQAIPNLNSPSKSSEWFAKMELMLNGLKDKDVKIHFIYKSSDFINNRDAHDIINYFADNNKVNKLDIDIDNEIVKLCNYIKTEAEDLKVG